jgi:hypothetical protein
VNAGLLRPVWLVSAATIAGAAIAAAATVLAGDPGEDDAKTIFSLLAVALCGGAAVGALYLVDRAGLRLLGAIVLLAAAVNLTLTELGIWKGVFFDGDSSNYVKLVPTGMAWGLALLVLATLPLLATDPRLRLTAVSSVGACALVGATVATVMIWRDLDDSGWIKTLAVLAIATLAGYLITPLAERLLRPNSSPSRTAAVSDTTRV